jgi:hypothetical protein
MEMGRGTVIFACVVVTIAVGFIVLFAWIAMNREDFGAEHLFRTYPGLIVAMSAGFFGATFSMLWNSRDRASQGTLEDLSAACSWTTLTVRGAVGLGAAAILYFFFRSGLIDGNLWPDIDKLGFDMLGEPGEDGEVDLGRQLVANKDWCLLIIWCFLAGFSETMVPNILVQTEGRNQATQAGSGR